MALSGKIKEGFWFFTRLIDHIVPGFDTIVIQSTVKVVLLTPTRKLYHTEDLQESLWHRSSPLPQYCLPLVLRLARTGLSALGCKIMLKICFPVHKTTG